MRLCNRLSYDSFNEQSILTNPFELRRTEVVVMNAQRNWWKQSPGKNSATKYRMTVSCSCCKQLLSLWNEAMFMHRTDLRIGLLIYMLCTLVVTVLFRGLATSGYNNATL